MQVSATCDRTSSVYRALHGIANICLCVLWHLGFAVQTRGGLVIMNESSLRVQCGSTDQPGYWWLGPLVEEYPMTGDFKWRAMIVTIIAVSGCQRAGAELPPEIEAKAREQI